MNNVLIIGVGNAWRRDDGAGPVVAERLAGRPGLRTMIMPGEGAELMDAWATDDRVIVVDAMRSGEPVGTIRRFDAVRGSLPAGAFSCLSHRFGLAEAVEMARALDRLPSELEIFGIEAADFGQGPGLTPEVQSAAQDLADRIAADVGPQ